MGRTAPFYGIYCVRCSLCPTPRGALFDASSHPKGQQRTPDETLTFLFFLRPRQNVYLGSGLGGLTSVGQAPHSSQRIEKKQLLAFWQLGD